MNFKNLNLLCTGFFLDILRTSLYTKRVTYAVTWRSLSSEEYLETKFHEPDLGISEFRFELIFSFLFLVGL